VRKDGDRPRLTTLGSKVGADTYPAALPLRRGARARWPSGSDHDPRIWVVIADPVYAVPWLPHHCGELA